MKRLLLIAPVFFGYYKDMILEAEELGYHVDYLCDAPSNSNISKALGRINKKLISGSAKRYYKENALPLVEEEQYDKVLLVAGMTCAFTADMFCEMRRLQKQAEFILYQWDSEVNLPYCKSIHPYFDRIYTFEKADSEQNKIYRFMPTFYTRIYEKIGKKERPVPRYDCFYVGTAHPKKYLEINRMAEDLKTELPRQFIYHYIPSVLKYVYHKVTAKEYRHARYRDFQKVKLSGADIMKGMEVSACILDAPQGGQTGLTLRCFECMGAKRKLITTNADIVNYDFYRASNILVYPGTIEERKAFFENPYEELPEELYRKYSMNSWMKRLLSGEESQKLPENH